MKRSNLNGLYALTPDEPDTVALLARVQEAIIGGARVVQYRRKGAASPLKLEQAKALVTLCRAHQVPLIVNDDLGLALAVDADGLHLGAQDGSLMEARRQLGPDKWLGASCYAQIELAEQAIAQGADHVAFGSFFASQVKPGAVRPPVQLLVAARRLKVPVVAIGGITLSNAKSLITAGADCLAVITALFSAPDVAAVSRQFTDLFESEGHETKSKTL